jgi:preprotein translocase subunit YajC
MHIKPSMPFAFFLVFFVLFCFGFVKQEQKRGKKKRSQKKRRR